MIVKQRLKSQQRNIIDQRIQLEKLKKEKQERKVIIEQMRSKTKRRNIDIQNKSRDGPELQKDRWGDSQSHPDSKRDTSSFKTAISQQIAKSQALREKQQER